MKERPILFSAPMVRAILDGSKTQTRRIVKPQPEVSEQGNLCGAWLRKPLAGLILPKLQDITIHSPYGQPGDRLWVRETWAQPAALDPGPTVYRADYPACVPAGFENIPLAEQIRWKPSIHMPRAASRILLEVTGVRVERLQDISEADAKAEGCAIECMTATGDDSGSAIYGPGGYRALWESINGPGSWEANPWVWVVEFKRVQEQRA